jgi:hypothetical protein
MRGPRMEKDVEIYATNIANKSKCISLRISLVSGD